MVERSFVVTNCAVKTAKPKLAAPGVAFAGRAQPLQATEAPSLLSNHMAG
jgi:hypothetical protein